MWSVISLEPFFLPAPGKTTKERSRWMAKETTSPCFSSFNFVQCFGREITREDLPSDITFLCSMSFLTQIALLYVCIYRISEIYISTFKKSLNRCAHHGILFRIFQHLWKTIIEDHDSSVRLGIPHTSPPYTSDRVGSRHCKGYLFSPCVLDVL